MWCVTSETLRHQYLPPCLESNHPPQPIPLIDVSYSPVPTPHLHEVVRTPPRMLLHLLPPADTQNAVSSSFPLPSLVFGWLVVLAAGLSVGSCTLSSGVPSCRTDGKLPLGTCTELQGDLMLHTCNMYDHLRHQPSCPPYPSRSPYSEP